MVFCGEAERVLGWESVCEYLPAAGAKEKSSLGCILINLLNLAVQVGYDFVC